MPLKGRNPDDCRPIAFLHRLFYPALVSATVHWLKQAKTKKYQFSTGQTIIVFDAMADIFTPNYR